MLASLGLSKTSAGPGSAAAAGLVDRSPSGTATGAQVCTLMGILPLY